MDLIDEILPHASSYLEEEIMSDVAVSTRKRIETCSTGISTPGILKNLVRSICP